MSDGFTKLPFEEKKPLTNDQLKLAALQIEDLHPIDGTYLDIAFPWACCCLKKYRNMNAGDSDNVHNAATGKKS